MPWNANNPITYMLHICLWRSCWHKTTVAWRRQDIVGRWHLLPRYWCSNMPPLWEGIYCIAIGGREIWRCAMIYCKPSNNGRSEAMLWISGYWLCLFTNQDAVSYNWCQHFYDSLGSSTPRWLWSNGQITYCDRSCICIVTGVSRNT